MMSRMWINAPKNSPMYKYHGEHVLASPGIKIQKLDGNDVTWHRVYFVRGSTVCMYVPTRFLSYGWTAHTMGAQP